MVETLSVTPREKNYFLLKLLAPRPGFATDMTEAELHVMQQHAACLKGYVDKGTIIVMGPVLDPSSAWGLAIVEADAEEEVRSIIAQDPTILSGPGFRYEIFPMLRALVRK